MHDWSVLSIHYIAIYICFSVMHSFMDMQIVLIATNELMFDIIPLISCWIICFSYFSPSLSCVSVYLCDVGSIIYLFYRFKRQMVLIHETTFGDCVCITSCFSIPIFTIFAILIHVNDMDMQIWKGKQTIRFGLWKRWKNSDPKEQTNRFLSLSLCFFFLPFSSLLFTSIFTWQFGELFVHYFNPCF